MADNCDECVADGVAGRSDDGQVSDNLVTEGGKNRLSVVCVRCDSVVLRESAADLCDTREFDLPQMTVKAAAAANGPIATDRLRRWWTVADMFSFENVGYSHAVDGVKFLTCADCEIGPIGFVDPQSKLNFVALDRIRHK